MTKIIDEKTDRDYEKLNKIIGSGKINIALLKKLMQILGIENNNEIEKMFSSQLKK